MCRIIYNICGICAHGHVRHTELCEEMHPPLRWCPVGAHFDFRFVPPELCMFHPWHNTPSLTGYDTSYYAALRQAQRVTPEAEREDREVTYDEYLDAIGVTGNPRYEPATFYAWQLPPQLMNPETNTPHTASLIRTYDYTERQPSDVGFWRPIRSYYGPPGANTLFAMNGNYQSCDPTVLTNPPDTGPSQADTGPSQSDARQPEAGGLQHRSGAGQAQSVSREPATRGLSRRATSEYVPMVVSSEDSFEDGDNHNVRVNLALVPDTPPTTKWGRNLLKEIDDWKSKVFYEGSPYAWNAPDTPEVPNRPITEGDRQKENLGTQATDERSAWPAVTTPSPVPTKNNDAKEAVSKSPSTVKTSAPPTDRKATWAEIAANKKVEKNDTPVQGNTSAIVSPSQVIKNSKLNPEAKSWVSSDFSSLAGASQPPCTPSSGATARPVVEHQQLTTPRPAEERTPADTRETPVRVSSQPRTYASALKEGVKPPVHQTVSSVVGSQSKTSSVPTKNRPSGSERPSQLGTGSQSGTDRPSGTAPNTSFGPQSREPRQPRQLQQSSSVVGPITNSNPPSDSRRSMSLEIRSRRPQSGTSEKYLSPKPGDRDHKPQSAKTVRFQQASEPSVKSSPAPSRHNDDDTASPKPSRKKRSKNKNSNTSSGGPSGGTSDHRVALTSSHHGMGPMAGIQNSSQEPIVNPVRFAKEEWVTARPQDNYLVSFSDGLRTTFCANPEQLMAGIGVNGSICIIQEKMVDGRVVTAGPPIPYTGFVDREAIAADARRGENRSLVSRVGESIKNMSLRILGIPDGAVNMNYDEARAPRFNLQPQMDPTPFLRAVENKLGPSESAPGPSRERHKVAETSEGATIAGETHQVAKRGSDENTRADEAGSYGSGVKGKGKGKEKATYERRGG